MSDCDPERPDCSPRERLPDARSLLDCWSELIARAKAMVLVSHDLTSLAELCDRVLWMDHGQVRQIGGPSEVIEAYQAHQTQKVRAA